MHMDGQLDAGGLLNQKQPSPRPVFIQAITRQLPQNRQLYSRLLGNTMRLFTEKLVKFAIFNP